jgi:hypothetical protein
VFIPAECAALILSSLTGLESFRTIPLGK